MTEAPSDAPTDLRTRPCHPAGRGRRRSHASLAPRRLPRADLDDLRQDLLVDLIRRLPAFDARRGSIGAFAGIVLRNQASRIATRLRERRATEATSSRWTRRAATGPPGRPARRGRRALRLVRRLRRSGGDDRRRIDLARALGALERGTSRSAPPLRSARSAASPAGVSAPARPSTAASATSAACSPPMARGRRETVREP